VIVTGSSMLPTLAPGDFLVVRWSARVRPGDVVVVRLPDRRGASRSDAGRPEGVKRVVGAVDGGWWVEGDNAEASTDSRTFGPVEPDAVLGRVLLRYWPPPARRLS
jgi:nickel-type superoxide dismutase maturation protease